MGSLSFSLAVSLSLESGALDRSAIRAAVTPIGEANGICGAERERGRRGERSEGNGGEQRARILLKFPVFVFF